MFNPDQVQAWHEKPLPERAARHSFRDRQLGSAELKFSPVDRSPRPSVTAGTLQKPVQVFGTPKDPSCLDGIEHWPVRTLPTRLLTLPGARIVGNGAVLSDDNELYLPEQASLLTQAAFIATNSYGQQGFLIDAHDGRVAIRFAQRPAPRVYPLNAVFLYNIEPGNYGSFIFRQLPQLLALKESEREFDCYISAERTSFLLEAIELLDLPRKPVFSAPEVTGDRFKSITVVHVDDAEGFIGPDTRILARRLVEKVAGPTSSVPDALYVSRALSTLRFPGYRVMTNELEVEALVRSHGVEVVYPETLSLKEQIRVFQGASRFIGPSGSGMFNILFAQRPERVVDIETYHVTVRQHAKFYSACGAAYSFLFSPFINDEEPTPMIGASVCPPDVLTQALAWVLS